MIADATLINDFIDESHEYILTIEENLLILESQKDDPEFEVIDKVFRGIHSIKGSSGFLDFRKITELSHIMETLLDKMRANEIKPESHYIDALLKSTDLLKQMIDDVHQCDRFDTKDMVLRLSQLSSDPPPEKKSPSPEIKPSQPSEMENHEAKNAVAPISEPVPPHDSTNHCFAIHFDLNQLYAQEDISPVDLIRDLHSMGDILDARLESSALSIDQDLSDCHLSLDIVYETALEKNVVMTMFILSEDAITDHQHKLKLSMSPLSQQPENVSSLIPKIAEKIDAAPFNESSDFPVEKRETQQPVPSQTIPVETEKSTLNKSEPSKSQESSGSIRISVDILDKLMSLASELVLVRNRLLMESSNADPEIVDIAQNLDVVTSEMQETVMLTRMQPLGNVFNKMPRIVRDLTRRFHKNIDIQITGNDVELDKNILEVLSSPLVHIIRNACDHGIEMPDIRHAQGKPETGLISVNAYHQAGLIHIEISDDGKGLDPATIRTKAIEKGIISKADLDQLNDKDVFSLIMTPGFSTAAQMNDVSGRGVGMDVVKTAIAQIGGVIEIDSEAGAGIRIHLSLPLTLAIIPCLIIVTNKERFAIPQVNMDEMVRLYDTADHFIESSGDQEVYRLRDRLLPIVRLKELLKRSIRYTHQDRSEITKLYADDRKTSTSVLFAVVKTGSRRFGLMIDKMTGTEEIVVNPLPNTLKHLQIYQGTTIMGDGEVAMVLDIDGISRHVGVEFNRTAEDDTALLAKKTQSANIQRILTFEYGPKEQFAIPLILIRRLTHIQNSQIEQVGANDDREFVLIDGEPVFIVRLDRLMDVSKCLEQPQYYLCLFRNSGTPFGILFTKLKGVVEMPEVIQKENYNLNCIFACAVVNDRLTLLLDIFELLKAGEKKWFSSGSILEKTDRTISILLVEDTVFFSQLIRNFLESGGYKVYTAENGLEALSVLEKSHIDLIVSDIEMPIMDGWRFIQAVRNNKHYQHIPAMALTALNSRESMDKSKQMGFNAHEVKIDKDRMLACVDRLLKKS
ncbi:MAG: hybrid sensor histidine kinase/response regulator [Candidatus Magnetomorum sp.]|nr:hybrid sensor histidine kinase/response regulator [Candidatus Magnetomorum sp.]